MDYFCLILGCAIAPGKGFAWYSSEVSRDSLVQEISYHRGLPWTTKTPRSHTKPARSKARNGEARRAAPYLAANYVLLRSCQLVRRDSTIFIRDALTAGSTPPTRPMIKAKTRPFQKMLKVRVKLKASSEKVWKFIVEIVISCRNEAK